MFSLRVINTARFLKMPTSTQCLYFHLGLHADDDGIVEAYPILNSIGATEDDLKILVAKNFVNVLNEDLVTYITDWKENNKIRADRKVDSIYKDLLLQVIPEAELIESKERTDHKIRSQAYKEGDLPDKFNGVIRNLFKGETCPVCGETMLEGNTKPSIQHNKALARGGKHELNNISVICLSCNMSLKNKDTDSLNNDLVKSKWNEYLLGATNGQPMGSIGKDRLGKDRLGKDSLDKDNIPIEEECVNEYVSEKLSFMSKLYQKNIGMANGIVGEWLIDISNQIDVDLFKKALEICTEKGKLNFGYLKGIIKNWLDINITSLEQLQAYELQNNKTSNNSITSKQKNIPATQKQCDDAEFKRRLEESNKLLDSLDENIWGD